MATEIRTRSNTSSRVRVVKVSEGDVKQNNEPKESRRGAKVTRRERMRRERDRNGRCECKGDCQNKRVSQRRGLGKSKWETKRN